jgi:hypothetical protein
VEPIDPSPRSICVSPPSGPRLDHAEFSGAELKSIAKELYLVAVGFATSASQTALPSRLSELAKKGRRGHGCLLS